MTRNLSASPSVVVKGRQWRRIEIEAMFELVWLKDGDMVLREEIGYKSAADAVAYARARAAEIVGRLPGREPDSFRLIDLSRGASAMFSIASDDIEQSVQ